MGVTYVKYWFYRPAVDYNESDNAAILFEVQLSWVWQRQKNIQSHDTKKDDVFIFALLYIHWFKKAHAHEIQSAGENVSMSASGRKKNIMLAFIFIEANDTKTI